MARRIMPRDELGARLPMLLVSLLCVVAAVALFAAGRVVGALTAMLAAFIIVAAAKRR
jgi:hypothetical protein